MPVSDCHSSPPNTCGAKLSERPSDITASTVSFHDVGTHSRALARLTASKARQETPGGMDSARRNLPREGGSGSPTGTTAGSSLGAARRAVTGQPASPHRAIKPA